MRRILGCFIFLMIMITSQIFAGTVYYVDATNGNDLNDGLSEVTAWQTVSKVNSSSFFPGDSILFKRGEIWREQLTVPSSGSSGSPITFGAYGFGNLPKILGSVAKNSTGDWTNESGNLWYASSTNEIMNLIMDSEASQATMVVAKVNLDTQGEAWYDDPNNRIYVYSASNPATYYNGSIECAKDNYLVNVNAKSYVTLEYLDCRYTGNNGVVQGGASNGIVDNCIVKFTGNNFSGDTHWNGTGIWITSHTNSTVSNNTISYTLKGINAHAWGGSMVVLIEDNTIIGSMGVDSNSDGILFSDGDYDGSIVQRNDISTFTDDGIDLYFGSNIIVQENIIHDSTGSGEGNGIKMGMNASQTGNQALRNHIYNLASGTNKEGIRTNGSASGVIAYNVIHDVEDGILIHNLSVGTDNYEVYNNVCYGCSAYGIQVGNGINADNKLNTTVKNNIFSGTTADFITGTNSVTTGGYNCLINDASVTNNGTYTGSSDDLYETNPLFNDALNNNFMISINSPCIDTGTDVGLTEDYAGNIVPQGAWYDIGAYEYTGASPLNANINASPTSGLIPLTVNFMGSATGGTPPYSYSWNFGDGASSSEQNPSHAYSQAGDYTVTLTVADSDSNQDTDTLTINASAVIIPLEASFVASPTSGEVPLTVNFTGNATGGTPPYSYNWDFRDGTSSSDQNPSHTYNDAGDYTVILTVTDSQSNQDNDSLSINASAVIAPLQVSFIASPNSGEVPLTVNFTGSATGGVLPYSYSWDFGDGTSSSEQNPSHTYSEAGNYTVYLSVTDSQSNQDSDSLTINASVASIPPYLSCSPVSLYFGSTTPGNESSDQYLRIINAGGGVLTWNIEDDAAWLSCSPSSGTNRGEIAVSVNTSGLPQGLYTATIIVSSPEAYNSPQYVSVNLRVYESEEESSPFGSFDTRLNGSTVSGSVPITGWALDDIETMGVEIKRNSDPEDPPEAIGPDGLVYLGDAVFIEGARPNVENSYPEYPLNSRAGWGYMLLTNSLPNRGNGFFTIYAFAYDAGDIRVEIGRKTIFCDNTNSVKPFGTVDTPEQGESIGGSDYINFGWTLTPLPKTIPKNGSTILLWVDGVQVGEPVYNQYREDIATLYPEYNNAQGAVGYYYLDTTQYENGVHTITWSVMDDGGEVDGIGARYFSIDNIETGNVNQERFELKRIYQEDVEGRLIIDMKEFRIGYKPQDDNNIILHLKRESRKGYRLQVEEMEPLRIVLEGSSGGNMNYIGWGESDWRALPIGSTFDPEKGIFSWIPTPGFIGKYRLYFAVTDGSYMSKPLQILVNVIPKSYD